MKLFCALTILLMLPICLAVDDEMKLSSFKIFVDGKSQRVDFDQDGEEVNAQPGSDIDVQIRLENDFNETVDVDFELTLFDISGDITRDESIDIGENRKETVNFEFILPDDVREDNYDLDVRYFYSSNDKQ